MTRLPSTPGRLDDRYQQPTTDVRGPQRLRDGVGPQAGDAQPDRSRRQEVRSQVSLDRPLELGEVELGDRRALHVGDADGVQCRLERGERSDDWATVFDLTRRKILDLLLELGEGSATSLADRLPVTRQAVVKHLRANE